MGHDQSHPGNKLADAAGAFQHQLKRERLQREVLRCRSAWAAGYKALFLLVPFILTFAIGLGLGLLARGS
jgi:hypothetical protein